MPKPKLIRTLRPAFLPLVLKAQDGIVGIPNLVSFPLQARRHHLLEPLIECVVLVDVGQERADRLPLSCPCFAYEQSLLLAPTPPSRLPPDFPGFLVIRLPAPPISRRDEEDFSNCLTCPCHRAALLPRPSESPRQSVCDDPCCLGPEPEGSASGSLFFRGHLWVHFRCGPVTRSPSRGWLCQSASSVSFPPRM